MALIIVFSVHFSLLIWIHRLFFTSFCVPFFFVFRNSFLLRRHIVKLRFYVSNSIDISCLLPQMQTNPMIKSKHTRFVHCPNWNWTWFTRYCVAWIFKNSLHQKFVLVSGRICLILLFNNSMKQWMITIKWDCNWFVWIEIHIYIKHVHFYYSHFVKFDIPFMNFFDGAWQTILIIDL